MASQNRVVLMKRSMLCAFAWGLAAHAYGFFNALFSHDSLNALVAGPVEEHWKLELGRFMVPLYRMVVRPGLAMPWLIGVLSLLMLGATVYLTARLFKVEGLAPVALIAGIYATNLTVTAMTATYIYELDLSMAALLLATAAVWCWRKYFPWGIAPGAALLCLSMGFYQAYFAVALMLILCLSVLSLSRGKPFGQVLVRGLSGIGLLLAAGGLYALAVKVVCAATNTQLASGYNSLTKVFKASDVPLTEWMDRAVRFWSQTTMTALIPSFGQGVQSFLQYAMLAVGVAALVLSFIREKAGALSIVLCAVLVSLIPLGADCLYVLDRGMVHDLMIFAFFVPYVLAVALIFSGRAEGVPATVLRWACGVLVGVMLWGGVTTSNAVYLKKDLEKEGTLALMSRVVEHIETFPGYKRGETPVAVIGRYQQGRMEGFGPYYSITGASKAGAITGSIPAYFLNMYEAYFDYILNANVKMCKISAWHRLSESEEVRAMPFFPEEGSLQMIDDILVVHMSDSL